MMTEFDLLKYVYEEYPFIRGHKIVRTNGTHFEFFIGSAKNPQVATVTAKSKQGYLSDEAGDKFLQDAKKILNAAHANWRRNEDL